MNIYSLLYFLAKSICKVMGMRCIRNKRLGAALTWFLRSKVSLENIFRATLNSNVYLHVCTGIYMEICSCRMLPLLQFLQKSMYIFFSLIIKIGFFLIIMEVFVF